jgi:hypothetical protein
MKMLRKKSKTPKGKSLRMVKAVKAMKYDKR